jgi:hypothetical protein
VAAPPPALESAHRVREAMQAWVTGLGRLAPDLAPVADDGQLQPTGARVDGTHLTTAWYKGDDELPPVADLPLQVTRRPLRNDWWLVHGAAPGSASTWAWPWTMHELRTILQKRLRRRGLRPRPGGVLEREARWRLCNGILGRGRGSVRPVEVGRVIAAIENRLADVSPDVVSATFMFSGIGTLSHRELRRLADELAQSGLVTIEPLWESPDLPRAGGRWVWSDYSPAALLRRTRQVYQGALDAYVELVDEYFPAWRSTLGMAGSMPLRLQGTLEPTTPDTDADGPGLFWTVLPLEPGSENRVEINLGESRDMWPDWEAFSAWDRSRHEALQRWRPEVLPYVRLDQSDGMLSIFGSRPATLLAYEWLSEDLHQLGWLSSKITHHLED